MFLSIPAKIVQVYLSFLRNHDSRADFQKFTNFTQFLPDFNNSLQFLKKFQLRISCKKASEMWKFRLIPAKAVNVSTNLEETRKLRDLKILVNSYNNSKSLPFLRNHESCAKQFRNFANLHKCLQKLSTKIYDGPNIAGFQASKITT